MRGNYRGTCLSLGLLLAGAGSLPAAPLPTVWDLTLPGKIVVERQDSSHQVLFCDGKFFAPSNLTGMLDVISPHPGELLASLASASAGPNRVIPGGDGRIYLTHGNDNQVLVVNTRTLAAERTIDLGGLPIDPENPAAGIQEYWVLGGAAWRNHLFLISLTEATLLRVDLATDRVTPLATQESAGLSGCTQVAVTDDRIFVKNDWSILDPRDNRLLVLDHQGNRVTEVETPWMTWMQGWPEGLATLNFAAGGRCRLALLSYQDLSVLRETWLTDGPFDVARDARGTVFVLTRWVPAVLALDFSTFTAQERYTFDPALEIHSPRGLAVTPRGCTLLVESEGRLTLCPRP